MGNYSSKDQQDNGPGGMGVPGSQSHQDYIPRYGAPGGGGPGGGGNSGVAERRSSGSHGHGGGGGEGDRDTVGSNRGSNTSDSAGPSMGAFGRGQLRRGSSIEQAPADAADFDFVPNVFTWTYGGKHVYITGTFNNWEKQIPMIKEGNDFIYVHNLRRGKHAYKFIVDDEWRYAMDQPTVADVEGRLNNFIDVTDFTPYVGDVHYFEKSKEQKIANTEFGQHIPDIDDYTKEPPPLPPHLRHIILNKAAPSSDPLSLPVPQYVSLNHLYCTAIKDGMMVLGSTQRYKEKYCTVVLYSQMPTPGGM